MRIKRGERTAKRIRMEERNLKRKLREREREKRKRRGKIDARVRLRIVSIFLLRNNYGHYIFY